MPYGLSTFEQVEKATGYEKAELRRILDSLTGKGLVMDLWINEGYHYIPSPMVVGIFEFTMMRMGPNANSREWARLFHEYMAGDDSFLAANLGAVIFIVTSMITLGLSNTVSQVLAPLKDKSLMIRVVLLNFILVPVLAFLLVTGLNLPVGLAIGLILVGTASGSPFLPRVIQIAAEKRALAGALAVLLTILSVGFIPVVVSGTTVEWNRHADKDCRHPGDAVSSSREICR